MPYTQRHTACVLCSYTIFADFIRQGQQFATLGIGLIKASGPIAIYFLHSQTARESSVLPGLYALLGGLRAHELGRHRGRRRRLGIGLAAGLATLELGLQAVLAQLALLRGGPRTRNRQY